MNNQVNLIDIVKKGNPKNFKMDELTPTKTATTTTITSTKGLDEISYLEDICFEPKETLKEKLENLKISIIAKREMKLNQERIDQVSTELNNIINIDLTKEGIKAYKEKQLKEILTLIEQLDKYHKNGDIDRTRKNIQLINKWLRILPRVVKDQEHLDIYIQNLSALRHKLFEWAIALQLQNVEQRQKAR